MTRIIERPEYLNKLISLIDVPDIKVITGIRRSGKSVLLDMLAKYIDKNFDDMANVIRIDYSLESSKHLLDHNALYEYISSRYVAKKRNFVFIDEVQMCPDFEKAVNWLHAENKYSIYITGSNAFLLSSDLATLFTGRTFSVEVYPFSFKEYMRYFKLEDVDAAFRGYVKDGGMAGAYLYGTEEERMKYLADVYDTLIIKDINGRYEIRNQALMGAVNDFLMDNISNQTSIRNIANMLSTNDSETSAKTIGNYIQYLMEAFAFYKVRRYDIHGKKYLSSQDKYYLADHAFRMAKLGTKNMDYGRVYENIVAIELMRRGYSVYVGAFYDREIDFVAVKRNEQIYIQVSDDISNPKTFDREIKTLLSIKDAYPKMIIANTKHDTYTRDGVKIVDLARWLTEE